jgi:hypothetical protein
MAEDGTDAAERRLYILIALAVVMCVGHHIDHVIRGNNVGWPIDSEVNAFTFSLLIYPLILVGLLLYRAGKGLPRDEIHAVLATDDPDLARRYLELHRERLEERLAAHLRTLRRIKRSMTTGMLDRVRRRT